MSGFALHALPVAGGALALSPMPGRGGYLVEDMELLRDWRPALVVTLTTLPEMEALGVGDLGSDIQASGARWAHFPVPDMDIPRRDAEAEWSRISAVALAALQGGGRVLFHCMGGCGRSGMAALRLMIDAGEDPESALARLRAVRPCAVETDAQMEWARRR